MYDLPLPEDRPPGLSGSSVSPAQDWWRLDTSPPTAWDWTGFADPRHRFDPGSGTFRTRYAARTRVGAFRERYRHTGFVVPGDHAGHHLVRLVPTTGFRVLDLRTEANLDALGIDDRVSTGREAAVWRYCHALADAVVGWWGGEVGGLRYRSRTSPQTSVNLAFSATTPLVAHGSVLADETDLLDELVVDHGFTVAFL